MHQLVTADLSQRFDKSTPLTINDLIQTLLDHKIKVYVCGGAPREWLLGNRARDIDLAVNCPVEQIEAICLGLFPPEWLTVIRNFGLVTVTGEHTDVDIGIMRNFNDINNTIEDSIFTPVEQIELDYLFRDFSVNCFYYNCTTKQIETPVAQAQQDLDNMQLRVTMGQKKIEFDQRICIRILQFIARGYQPLPETSKLLSERFDQDILDYDGFDKWLKIYIKKQSSYFNQFVELALTHVTQPQAKNKLQQMLADICPTTTQAVLETLDS